MMTLNLSLSDVVDCYYKMVVFYIAQFKINECVFLCPYICCQVARLIPTMARPLSALFVLYKEDQGSVEAYILNWGWHTRTIKTETRRRWRYSWKMYFLPKKNCNQQKLLFIFSVFQLIKYLFARLFAKTEVSGFLLTSLNSSTGNNRIYKWCFRARFETGTKCHIQ